MKDLNLAISYLIAEGFVRIEFDPEHPEDINYARVFLKTEAEILAEIED